MHQTQHLTAQHAMHCHVCSLLPISPYQLTFIMVAGEEPDPIFTVIYFGPESVNTYESIVQCNRAEDI